MFIGPRLAAKIQAGTTDTPGLIPYRHFRCRASDRLTNSSQYTPSPLRLRASASYSPPCLRVSASPRLCVIFPSVSLRLRVSASLCACVALYLPSVRAFASPCLRASAVTGSAPSRLRVSVTSQRKHQRRPETLYPCLRSPVDFDRIALPGHGVHRKGISEMKPDG
jgi:hypothetical protein